jgi:twitching motility protein PilT
MFQGTANGGAVAAAPSDSSTPPTTIVSSDDTATQLLHHCMQLVAQAGASDLHVRPGEPPFMRVRGELLPIPDMHRLDPAQVDGMIRALTARVSHRHTEFIDNGEADLSYELPGVARFRVNIFRERGNAASTMRVIPQEVPQLATIGVPPQLADLALAQHGLLLVTGATGSGKTTTLAAMIDHINRSRAAHILTIEDPIEIVHPNHRSLVSQRELGADTKTFAQALRRALRQDPDVILIGEIRDEETMRTALAAAETGHLVMATLHTINASETIARILDLFPSDFEKQARAMLAGALKGIVSQRLAKTVDNGRVPVVEILVHTARIADCIVNPEETGKLPEAIAAGGYYGMQTFDQALIGLIMQGRITEDEALHHVTSPQNFKLLLESTMGQAVVAQQRAAQLAIEQAAYEEQQAAYAAQQAALAQPQQFVPVPPPQAIAG